MQASSLLPPEDEEEEDENPCEVIDETQSVTQEQSGEPIKDCDKRRGSSFHTCIDRKPLVFQGGEDR